MCPVFLRLKIGIRFSQFQRKCAIEYAEYYSDIEIFCLLNFNKILKLEM